MMKKWRFDTIDNLEGIGAYNYLVVESSELFSAIALNKALSAMWLSDMIDVFGLIEEGVLLTGTYKDNIPKLLKNDLTGLQFFDSNLSEFKSILKGNQ
jgi:hypothetical protein